MFFQADREHVLRGRGADPDPGELVRHDPRGHLHRDKTHAHRPPLLPRQGEQTQWIKQGSLIKEHKIINICLNLLY